MPPTEALAMPKTYAKTDPNFGARMARLRKQAGFTQTEFAQHLGITRRMVAYYESENHYPPADTLAKIAKALGIAMDELIGQRKAKSNNKPHGNSHIMRRLKQLEQLPASEQKAVFKVIDAFLAKVS